MIETGCYRIINNSTFDAYSYIYKDNFNPNTHPSRLIVKDDSSLRGNQFKSIVRFQTSINYIFIMTTNDTNVTGVFSLLMIGPAKISFNRISKYFL